MGVWEGQPREHIYQMHVLQQIKEDPWNFAPPGGESQRQVEERMMSWLEQRVLPLKKSNGDPTRVLAVSHGLALKCLLRGIMGFSPQHAFRATLGNTGIIQLKHSTQGWHLIRFNDTAHLVHDAPLAQ
ncbi:MAG: histidine phosphatase family protein [Myxococcota bacterium]